MKKRIAELEKQVQLLLSVVAKDRITLTDESNPNNTVVISYVDGTFSTDKVTTEVTTTVTKENINNQNNL